MRGCGRGGTGVRRKVEIMMMIMKRALLCHHQVSSKPPLSSQPTCSGALARAG